MKLSLKMCCAAFACLFSTVLFAHDNWGKTGHRATGEIASYYLTDQAKKKIYNLLDGASLALVSTYADEIKSDPKYDKYFSWHYVNLPSMTVSYEEVKKNPEGDLIVGIRKCMTVLKDQSASKEEKVFFLKMLVHFVGDLHQPLHVGQADDRGGNDIRLEWFWDSSNLHRVWDSEMINSYRMSYSELAANQAELTKKELKEMQKGSLTDWAKESQVLAAKIYASVEDGDELSYEYMYQWFPTVRQQLQKGGVRLAVILNEIFG